MIEKAVKRTVSFTAATTRAWTLNKSPPTLIHSSLQPIR